MPYAGAVTSEMIDTAMIDLRGVPMEDVARRGDISPVLRRVLVVGPPVSRFQSFVGAEVSKFASYIDREDDDGSPV